jgi:hypothetical protein
MKMVTRNSRNRILRKSCGAITIFEMVPIIAFVFGIFCGITLGIRFGHAGAWLGGAVGGIFGLASWRFLFLVLCKWLDRKWRLSGRTTEELSEMLQNPSCKNPNEVLLELGIKGEKMENYLPIILGFMVSPLTDTRRRGWLTLVTIFPERAKIISDYQFIDPVEKCREKIQKLTTV